MSGSPECFLGGMETILGNLGKGTRAVSLIYKPDDISDQTSNSASSGPHLLYQTFLKVISFESRSLIRDIKPQSWEEHQHKLEAREWRS